VNVTKLILFASPQPKEFVPMSEHVAVEIESLLAHQHPQQGEGSPASAEGPEGKSGEEKQAWLIGGVGQEGSNRAELAEAPPYQPDRQEQQGERVARAGIDTLSPRGVSSTSDRIFGTATRVTSPPV
jgi:hypothetical protein